MSELRPRDVYLCGGSRGNVIVCPEVDEPTGTTRLSPSATPPKCAQWTRVAKGRFLAASWLRSCDSTRVHEEHGRVART